MTNRNSFNNRATRIITSGINSNDVLNYFFQINRRTFANVERHDVRHAFRKVKVSGTVNCPSGSFKQRRRGTVICPRSMKDANVIRRLPRNRINVSRNDANMIRRRKVTTVRIAICGIRSTAMLLGARQAELPAGETKVQDNKRSLQRIHNSQGNGRRFQEERAIKFFRRTFLNSVVCRRGRQTAFTTGTIRTNSNFLATAGERNVGRFI